MKRMKAKFLSLVLSVVMALSVLPLGAFAEEAAITKTEIDAAINEGIKNANNLTSKAGYAALSDLVGNTIIVTVCDGNHAIKGPGASGAPDGTGSDFDIFVSLVNAFFNHFEGKNVTVVGATQRGDTCEDTSTCLSAAYEINFSNSSLVNSTTFPVKNSGDINSFLDGVYGSGSRPAYVGGLINQELGFIVKYGSESATYKVKFVSHTASLKPVEEISATCVKEGQKAHYVCGNCGKMYKDQAGNTEITDKEIVIAKTAHKWGEPVEKDGKWVKICSVCKTEEPTEAPTETPKEPETQPATEASTTPAAPAPTVAQTAAPEAPAVTVAGNVPKNVALKTGQSTTKIQVPLAAGDSIVSVKSSNKKIAKVKILKNGKIKVKARKKTGTVKIKVKLASGKTIKFKVKVQKNRVLTSKVTAPEKLNLHKGEKAALNAKVKPFTSSQGISYHSSNPNVARVNKHGIVHALKKGTAIVTVVSGSKKAVCKVKVK